MSQHVEAQSSDDTASDSRLAELSREPEVGEAVGGMHCEAIFGERRSDSLEAGKIRGGST